jgi:parallel beta-helix repeat protein
MNVINKTGGTASAPITFTAEAGTVVAGVGLGTNASMAAINIESTGGWYVIEGFTIRGSSSMQRAGIRSALSAHTVIRNNTVSGAFNGIFASRSDGVVVENNVCANATDEHGIYVNGSRDYVIRGNTCYGNSWDGIHVNVSDGVNTINDGGLIEGNRVHDNALSGLDVDGATNLTIRNNVVYANWKHGITVYNANQNPVPPSQNVTVVNNTLADNDMYGLQVQSGNATGMTVFNNILTGNSSGSVNMIGSLPSTFISDYNVMSDKRTTGQDSHSVIASSSQLFVNAGTGDYHLKAVASAIDAGTASLNGKSGPTADVDGAARPQGNGYDAGADEVGSSNPPADTTAPALSGVAASGIAQSVATIGWTTDEGATSRVQYGTTTGYGSQTALDGTLATGHQVSLSGLTAGTLYHYRVISTDAAGNTATSADFTFTTSAPVDTTAPVIGGVGSANVTTSSAAITWTTDEGSTTQIEYGTTTSYGTKTALNSSLVTSHSANLSGLVAGTVYHYRVISKDAAGNSATSSDFTFTTATPPPPPPPTDTTPPAIAGVTSGTVTTSAAAITWTTDEASTSRVEYGTSTSYGSTTALDASLVTAHSLNLGGLSAGTVYHFRVISTDGAGNVATSSDFTFTTDQADPPPATQPGSDGLANSIAYDAAGNMSLAYFDGASNNLKYATRSADGTWSEVAVVDSAANAGTLLSLALDSTGRPGIAYLDARNADLKYAHFSGTTWDVQTVDSKRTTGYYPSLQFTAGDRPVISYYFKTGGDLRVAVGESSGWTIGTVDALGDVGRYSTLALNPLTGRWSVAYEDTTRGWFRYAEQTKSGWANSVVDSTTRSGGGYISLAFDPNTRLPAMSYYDAYAADLKFAAFDGSRWSGQVVASKGSVGLYSNLRIDVDTGAAEILYYNKRANGVFRARVDAGAWQFSQAVSDGGRWLSTAVAPDGTWTASWLGSSGINVGDL